MMNLLCDLESQRGQDLESQRVNESPAQIAICAGFRWRADFRDPGRSEVLVPATIGKKKKLIK